MDEAMTARLRALEGLKTLPMVLAIFLVGFSVVYLSHGPRLSDPDAWFQYKMAQFVLEDGRVPERYDLAYFPEGRTPWVQDNLFLPYLFAYTYRLASVFGFTAMEWAMLFPAVFQGLAAVAFFLAIKELWDARVALPSALLYAYSPLALSRVYSGTIDKEVLYGAFTFGSLYFFLRSYKTGIHLGKLKSLVPPLVAGILYGLSYANWSGGAYIILVITAAAVAHLVFERDPALMKSILSLAIVGPFVMYLVQPMKNNYSYFISNYNYHIPLAVGFLPLSAMVISERLKKNGKDVDQLKVMASMIAAVVLLFYLAGKGGTVENLIRSPMGLLAAEKAAQQNLYMATVAESQPSQLLGGGSTLLQRIMNGDYFRELGLAFFVLPVGALLLLLRLRNSKDFATIFTLAWLISGFIAADQGLRYLFFLAPSAAVVVGYAFARLYDEVKKREEEIRRILNSTSKKQVLQRASSRLFNIKLARLALIVSLMLVAMSNLYSAVAFRNFQSDLPRPWYDALIWTKENTPDNSVIFFWWDYGYYFQSVANRYTVADGGGNVLRNINLANMFSSPEDEAIKYIRKYVDYEKVPTYMVVSYEEFGKSGAINRIAGGDPETGETIPGKDGQLYITNFQVPATGDPANDEKNIASALAGNNPLRIPISTYSIVNAGDTYVVWVLIQFDRNGNYHPEWSEKLLTKLLPFNTGYGQGLKHFELVYRDREKFGLDYVLIYRVK